MYFNTSLSNVSQQKCSDVVLRKKRLKISSTPSGKIKSVCFTVFYEICSLLGTGGKTVYFIARHCGSISLGVKAGLLASRGTFYFQKVNPVSCKSLRGFVM